MLTVAVSSLLIVRGQLAIMEGQLRTTQGQLEAMKADQRPYIGLDNEPSHPERISDGRISQRRTHA
jgi:hypothetical protein